MTSVMLHILDIAIMTSNIFWVNMKNPKNITSKINYIDCPSASHSPLLHRSPSTSKLLLLYTGWGKINRSPDIFNYCNYLKKFNIQNFINVFSLPRDHFGDEEWCFQQDSAPAHKANETQEKLSEECPNFITRDEWLPNSPDLNPLNYSVWSILEERACAKPHDNVKSLKRVLKKAWKEISVEILAKNRRQLSKAFEFL